MSDGNEPWALYLLIFILVAVAIQQLQQGLGTARSLRRQKQKRFASLEAAGNPASLEELRRRSTRWSQSFLARHANQLIVQSGTQLAWSTIALMGLGLTLVMSLLLPVPASGALRALLATAVAISLIEGWLRIKRARRIARFGEQLPDVIDVIVRSLRAGHPLAVALNLVARETPHPAGHEFALVVDEVNYGRSLSEALEHLSDRVGYPELRFFVASTAIAHQTGGNLGEILSRLSRMLRDRFRLGRRVRALSAEGRFSGYALSVLPVALFGIINLVSASYYADFWNSAAARPLLAISIALLLVGNLVIYRLVNFKV
ncbi:type II secretion system F family protein [Lichenifustis flavocetrariae]|uniref:Type II secretion system F family protein n=1 Tax=Lichenifustis flavocetrariae TaxID=2949735 RepID=A0AA41Z0I9_9HYPH|nr:type II secretion system F family protein [Lichenifustis flavocetrariae]MCW6511946.1 type II secretion system F family protein [Lichenifustis flavocetrariae]